MPLSSPSVKSQYDQQTPSPSLGFLRAFEVVLTLQLRHEGIVGCQFFLRWKTLRDRRCRAPLLSWLGSHDDVPENNALECWRYRWREGGSLEKKAGKRGKLLERQELLRIISSDAAGWQRL